MEGLGLIRMNGGKPELEPGVKAKCGIIFALIFLGEGFLVFALGKIQVAEEEQYLRLLKKF